MVRTDHSTPRLPLNVSASKPWVINYEAIEHMSGTSSLCYLLSTITLDDRSSTKGLVV